MSRRVVIYTATVAAALSVLVAVGRLSPVPIIEHPPFVAGAEASWLAPDHLVLGVVLDGIAKAYPVGAVAPLEYLNDWVGDRPIGVSW